jgi:hypothetical protein
MATLSPWAWSVGHADSVDEEGVYDIDEQPTREAAIASGLRQAQPGETICIVEFRCWERQDEDRDVIPYARMRNHERIVVGPRGIDA